MGPLQRKFARYYQASAHRYQPTAKFQAALRYHNRPSSKSAPSNKSAEHEARTDQQYKEVLDDAYRKGVADAVQKMLPKMQIEANTQIANNVAEKDPVTKNC